MNQLDAYDIRRLHAASVSLNRHANGMLAGSVDGIEYAELGLARLYPLTWPTRFILVSGPENAEIGVIDDLDELSAETRAAAIAELQLRYVVPIVTCVHRIKQEPGLWRWHVDTDRGPLHLLLRNLHDHVRTLDDGRMLVTDLDGRRCEVRPDDLDARSRARLRKVQ